MILLSARKSVAACAAFSSLLLTGCGMSPGFVHEPPAFYRVPLPAEIQGVWAREGKDNGERVRVTAQGDGTMRIDFFKTKPSSQEIPQEPLVAQTLRFDDTDWLLVDMRKLSALQGGQYAGQAPYRLIKYALEDANRLCGIEPSAHLFAEGIKAGKLDGKVETYVGPLMRVTVTSAGDDWVKWWIGLPASGKAFVQPIFCFQKMNQVN